MTKNGLNQNGKYVQELIDTIEPDFVYSKKPNNRFNLIETKKNNSNQDKPKQLSKLKEQINSIENCNLKKKFKKSYYG